MRGRISESPGFIVIQVQQSSNPEAAASALASARQEIAELDGGFKSVPGLGPGDRNSPKFVSEVFTAGSGPFVTIDGGHTPDSLLRSIPEIVVRHLTDLGVTDGIVTSPSTQGPLLDHNGPVLDRLPRAVVLRLYSVPPHRRTQTGRLPAQWLGEATRWVSSGDAEVVAQVQSLQFPVPSHEANSFLEQCHAARMGAKLVAGELNGHIRVIATHYFGVPNIAIAAGGPAAGDEDLLGLFHDLKDVARRVVASAGYAFIALDPVFAPLGSAFHYAETVRGNDVDARWIAYLCDQLVLDAYPFQILGPGHMERLGGVPEGAKASSEGRFELTIGHPRSWLLEPSAYEVQPDPWAGLGLRRKDKRIQEEGRQVLSKCILQGPEVLRTFMALPV